MTEIFHSTEDPLARGESHHPRKSIPMRRDSSSKKSDYYKKSVCLPRGPQTPRVQIQICEKVAPDEAQGQCPFCTELDSREHVAAEFGTVVAIADRAPVAEGHLLIVTRRHTEDLFSMTAQEHADAMILARMLRARALALEPAITGFNVGANCGASAGQKVMHAHIHFIPRRCKTLIKGAIRNKMAY